MLEALKHKVCDANLRLVKEGLVILTWGNVSAVDRDRGAFVIKPSGVSYDLMKPDSMVVVSLESGEVLEGPFRPSSDAPTHRILYQAFSEVGAIVHSHSPHATSWAQAAKEIPPLGTTHADNFAGAIPLTRSLRKNEIESEYEANTGKAIAERFGKLDPLHVPGVLVRNHGPFAWGASLDDAVENAIVLEQVAKMAADTLRIDRRAKPMPEALLRKHFFRKHGKDATYGQTKGGR